MSGCHTMQPSQPPLKGLRSVMRGMRSFALWVLPCSVSAPGSHRAAGLCLGSLCVPWVYLFFILICCLIHLNKKSTWGQENSVFPACWLSACLGLPPARGELAFSVSKKWALSNLRCSQESEKWGNCEFSLGAMPSATSLVILFWTQGISFFPGVIHWPVNSPRGRSL